MPNLFWASATLFALTSLTTAVQVQREEALGDGHGKFWNLGGESFTVNQPGDYLLLRVPQDVAKVGKLIFRGDMLATDHAPCGVSMKSVTIYGDWMGDKVVHVGLHGGFGFKVSSRNPKFAGQWRTFAGNWTSSKLTGREAIPELVTINIVAAQEKAADNKTMGPAFEFHIGDQLPLDSRAVIVVAQSTSCKCLDVTMANLRRLSEPDLGGLLGTEKHDKAIELITPSCAASRRNMTGKENLLSTREQPQSSPHAASWTTDFQSGATGVRRLPAVLLLGVLAAALVARV